MDILRTKGKYNGSRKRGGDKSHGSRSRVVLERSQDNAKVESDFADYTIAINADSDQPRPASGFPGRKHLREGGGLVGRPYRKTSGSTLSISL